MSQEEGVSLIGVLCANVGDVITLPSTKRRKQGFSPASHSLALVEHLDAMNDGDRGAEGDMLFKAGLVLAVVTTFATGAAAAASGLQGALAISYGVMLDQHCGTHDAAAIMEELFAGSQFDAADKKAAETTVVTQYYSAGKERFCAATRGMFRRIVGREVD